MRWQWTSPAAQAGPVRYRPRQQALPASSSVLRPGRVDGDRKGEVFPWGRKRPGAAVIGVDPKWPGQHRSVEPQPQAAHVLLIQVELVDVGNRPAPNIAHKGERVFEG